MVVTWRGAATLVWWHGAPAGAVSSLVGCHERERRALLMRNIIMALVVGVLGLASGCAHEFTYMPVGPGAAGGPAARYPIPPTAPQGEVYVTSFGLTDLDTGQPGMMLHARLAGSNGSQVPGTGDGRQPGA